MRTELKSQSSSVASKNEGVDQGPNF